MTPITLADGQKIVLEPLERSQRRLGLKNFDPCSILLNNDLSAGIPAVLENLHEQYLLPPLHAGWAVRRKSTHFVLRRRREEVREDGRRRSVDGESVFRTRGRRRLAGA